MFRYADGLVNSFDAELIYVYIYTYIYVCMHVYIYICRERALCMYYCLYLLILI